MKWILTFSCLVGGTIESFGKIASARARHGSQPTSPLILAGDVGQHVAVDFHARRERLAAALLHFPTERGILDDVLLFVGQLVFPHDRADTFAPAAESFEVGGDFRG